MIDLDDAVLATRINREGRDALKAAQPSEQASGRFQLYGFSAELLKTLGQSREFIRVVRDPIPADAVIKGVTFDFSRNCFAVLIESQSFNLVPEGQLIPWAMQPLFTIQRADDDD